MNQQTSKLFNRDFFLLWQGQFVSQLGSQVFAVAMMLWIKHQTGSATLMGLLMTASMLPYVLLGPLAGTAADRYSRRRIIILSDLFCGIPVLVLALMMYTQPENPGLITAGLFFVHLILGAFRAFFSPAVAASIPDIVPQEKVAAANSLNQSTFQISQFIGQGAGGYFYFLLGAPLLVLINGLSYLFSSFSEYFIRIPQTIPKKSREWKANLMEFRNDMREGFAFAWNHHGLRALFFTAGFLNFFSMPIVVLLPFYVEDTLNLRGDWYGYFLAAFGFGTLFGYIAAGMFKLKGKIRGRAIVACLILMSSLLPFLGQIRSGGLALIWMIGIGILNGFFNINLITLLQLAVPTEIRGRVFGLLTTLTGALIPISMGLSGLVADLMNQNIPLLYSACGIIFFLLTLLTATRPAFRQFAGSDLPLNYCRSAKNTG